MTIPNAIERDYVNDTVMIYPFDEIDKKLETTVLKNNKNINEDYDVLHYGKFQKLLYSDFNKRLMPYINTVLDEYEYDGSVVYDEYIDRHSVFLMVTRVMEHLKNNDYFKDFAFDDFNKMVDGYTVLRSDVETMLLSELFFIRRLMYAKKGLLKKANKMPTTSENIEIYINNEFL